MLKVQNLSISLRMNKETIKPIVKNVNFELNSGEVLSIIGESGSGKTMTSLALTRLLPNYALYANTSQVLLADTNLLELSERNMQKYRGSSIAMIFQEPMNSLNPIYTVGRQICEVLSIHRNLHKKDAYLETLRLLENVKIKNPKLCFGSYPYELSGGMQQRVMIAMAIACRPKILIADEPTTALDVTTQLEILDLLAELQVHEKMSMLLITHDLAIAARVATKIAVMQDGKIIEQNSSDKFFADPKEQYSIKLLNSTPAHNKKFIQETEATVCQLSVENLKVHFPVKRGIFKRTVDTVKAVNDVSFKVFKGQTTALVGESGSGKTTIARALLGLLRNVSGNIIFENNNLARLANNKWKELRSQIQIIFQDPYSALDPKLTIGESLEEGLILHKDYTKQQRKAKIDALLDKVGLNANQNKYPHEFSGGERQRICIARALALDPKIIICDEPTSSLDVSVQAQVISLLQQLQKDNNLTYLFITHDLNIVRLLANQVVVLQNGKVVEAGGTKEVFNNPQNSYTKTLLEAIMTVP